MIIKRNNIIKIIFTAVMMIINMQIFVFAAVNPVSYNYYSSGIKYPVVTANFIVDLFPVVSILKSTCSAPIFIPTKSKAEWQSFVAHKPSCIETGLQTITSYLDRDDGDAEGDYETIYLVNQNSVPALSCPDSNYTTTDVYDVVGYVDGNSQYHMYDKENNYCKINNPDLNFQCGVACDNGNGTSCNDMKVRFVCVQGIGLSDYTQFKPF